MKIWTQEQMDAEKSGLDGVLRIGGDLRACNLYGRSRVHIAPDSLIGERCILGDSCVIGEGCQAGKGLTTGRFTKIGDNCRLGENAHIGFGSRIGSGVSLASGCVIEEETQIAEDAELPTPCTLYGVRGVIGHTRITMGPIMGRRIQAVKALQEGGTQIYVHCTGTEMMTIDEMAAAARRMRGGHRETWDAVLEALAFIAARYAHR
ncbi:MAG: hypothetical protein J6K32_08210 [Clostridia bacterium]|nr:hypothetical protein [Clostridia bacterium]